MGGVERQPLPGKEQEPTEILDPRHFYAAYVFDDANDREADIGAIVTGASELGYPVRYWWLSDAMELRGYPDRLIVCVHHPSSSEDAGMDLYDALKLKEVTWDELDAAVVDEYRYLGKSVKEIGGIRSPYGNTLFPRKRAEDEITFRTSQAAALLLVTKDAVREAAQEKLGRNLSDQEFSAILTKFSKALDWLDWSVYLDEAIGLCQEAGLIEPFENGMDSMPDNHQPTERR